MFSVFQATLTLSEDDSIGNSIQLAWTLWRATLVTSAWIFSAVEMYEPLTCGESDQILFFLFFLTMKRSFWNRDIFMFKEMKRSPWTLVMFYSIYWYSDQFHLLLRKTKVCFLRLGTSCAAIFIFILHISSPYDWDLGPVLIMCDASANCIVITSCLSAWSWDFWLISVHR